MGALVADTAELKELEDQLDMQDRHGYLLVRNALDIEMVEAWQTCLMRKYKCEQWDISNEVECGLQPLARLGARTGAAHGRACVGSTIS